MIRRQLDVERLYSLSRAILLTSREEPFAKQLVQKLADGRMDGRTTYILVRLADGADAEVVRSEIAQFKRAIAHLRQGDGREGDQE